MLAKKDLIERVGVEYTEMIKQISIPDFTKCIAQYADIPIQKIQDEVIIEYLSKWCKNKKRFFKMMGGKTRIDIPFTYTDLNDDYTEKFTEIGTDFPAFYPWCQLFRFHTENKISYQKFPPYEYRNLIDDAFQNNISAEGMSITHFFKQYLKIPDEVVTRVGTIFENKKIDANFTISIDPVDMMLASENPYGWTSCYRLENDFEDGHADGCLAALLDSTSLITYIWNNSGKFSLYKKYEFKDIRYKRMRMTIAISKDFKAIHFNSIYPAKGRCDEDFKKQLREMVENLVSNELKIPNLWKINDGSVYIGRTYNYGYNEYEDNSVYINSKEKPNEENFEVFDEPIICPCGCENIVPGTSDENYHYNGCGYLWENMGEERYCEYTDEYEDCDGDCEHCRLWNVNNAVCELDNNYYCEERNTYDAEDEGDADFDYSNIISCNIEHCFSCPLFREHKPQFFKDIEIREKETDTMYLRKSEQWYVKDKKDNLYHDIYGKDVICVLGTNTLNHITNELLAETEDSNENFEIVKEYDEGYNLEENIYKEEPLTITINTDLYSELAYNYNYNNFYSIDS